MNTCPNKEQLAKRLTELRKGAGYKSRAAFAEALGMKPTKYQEYEAGRTTITLELAWQISDILGISLDEFGGREWHDQQQSAISHDEEVLLSEYRECTPRGRDVIHETARGQAVLAKASGVGSKRYDAAVNE